VAGHIETCTILTTQPNSLVADVHNRMPVILSRDDYDQWLDPGETDPALVADLLKPFDARPMRCFPVSNHVSRNENDDAEPAREVSPKDSTPTLF
jgi:putative SOS response-associated peptidase YedK